MSPPLRDLNFDVDHYLNRIIPQNRLHALPEPISWFLGYRKTRPSPIGNVLIWFWAFVGAFAGILVVEAVFHTQALRAEGTPIVIASLGAAAVLEYHTVESPLSQPRNAILGQILSATIGIGITKLFQHSPHFEALRWIAGALSVGLASALMGVTKTVHPPAGATALLCATSPDITNLGWFLLPLIALGSVLLVAVACVVNNIQRQFPVCWWTPEALSRKKESDIEKSLGGKDEIVSRSSAETHVAESEGRIVIDGDEIAFPDWLPLGYEERAVLEVLRAKLRDGKPLEVSRSRESEATQVG